MHIILDAKILNTAIQQDTFLDTKYHHGSRVHSNPTAQEEKIFNNQDPHTSSNMRTNVPSVKIPQAKI